jgi:transcriptional regulator with XRE-family HTH domain
MNCVDYVLDTGMLRLAVTRTLLSVRTRLGLTQSELAQRLGVTQSAVSQYKRGSARPSKPVLKILLSMAETEPEKTACQAAIKAMKTWKPGSPARADAVETWATLVANAKVATTHALGSLENNATDEASVYLRSALSYLKSARKRRE